jgi:DNA-binding LacI/PurR family transcriptional regulator
VPETSLVDMGIVPRRPSLAEHVTEILRGDILRGRWPAVLPGENQLSDEFKVGRTTLRQALRALEMEGWFRTRRGCRRELAPARRRRRAPGKQVIALVSSHPLHAHSSRSILVVDELRRHLQRHGWELHLQVAPPGGLRALSGRLERMVAEIPAACWILSSCSRELQRWFAERSLPALVQGSCYEGIRLPFMRQDLAAACRHAVGRLRVAGHERIDLLMPPHEFAGSIEIEAAFRATLGEGPGRPAGDGIIRHRGEAAGVERALRAALSRRLPPTAAIVMMAEDALTAHCHLLRHGLAVPQRFSLVSMLDDNYLRRTLPEVTRYTIDQRQFARRFVRQVLTLAHGAAAPASISIDPDFVPGGTLGPVPP